MRQLAIATLVAAFALGAPLASATAQSSTDAPRMAAKKHPAKKHTARPAQASGQIACTVLGCGRIPPNCHPTQGYRSDGTPTGNDVIVCR